MFIDLKAKQGLYMKFLKDRKLYKKFVFNPITKTMHKCLLMLILK
jgi:hypothetical protein